MILDIAKWKEEISRLRSNLESSFNCNNDFQIERDLYYLAIAIRKLMKNRLAPTGMGTESLNISRYVRKPDVVDGLNYLDADVQFDLDNGQKDQMKRKRLFDIIIHSTFLDWRLRDGCAVEILLSSDFEATALGIPTSQLLTLVDSIVATKFKIFPLPSARRGS